jgi:hypothetical protein
MIANFTNDNPLPSAYLQAGHPSPCRGEGRVGDLLRGFTLIGFSVNFFKERNQWKRSSFVELRFII